MVFEALNDPTRRKLLERLNQGPCSVKELVNSVAVSQPAVSQHLNVLKAARLVHVTRRAQQRIYSINHEGLAEVRIYLDHFWESALTSFQKASEKTANEETSDE
jgi:DNA-binding transcriptional ArsR family regulator